MPNHVHGIIIINDDNNNTPHVGAKNFSPLQMPKFQSPKRTIGSIVRGFKIGVTKWFRQKTEIHNVWQRNYYEHIIRNNDDLIRILEYINNNPSKWE